jgi:hypothetical protein
MKVGKHNALSGHTASGRLGSSIGEREREREREFIRNYSITNGVEFLLCGNNKVINKS